MITSDRRSARTRNTTIIVVLDSINAARIRFSANVRVGWSIRFGSGSAGRQDDGLAAERADPIVSHRRGESPSPETGCPNVAAPREITAQTRPRPTRSASGYTLRRAFRT